MPIRLIDPADTPTYVEKPDIRFATTFISHEYRDYAVDGEAIMDKMTGELFVKRPEDGRVLSFEQNKKYAYDQMLELKILLTNDEDFTYPKNVTDSYYVSTNYDLVAINKEAMNDIIQTGELEIPIEGDPGADLRNTLSFNLSGECNGFFCRPTSRDSDKMALRIITNIYDTLVQEYEDNNSSIRAERNRFQTIEKWKESDVIITYDLEIIAENRRREFKNIKDYLRVNEHCCVFFPVDVMKNYRDGYDSVKVTITKLEFYKLNFVKNLDTSLVDWYIQNVLQMEDPPLNIESALDIVQPYLCVDGRIYVYYLNIISFVDKFTDIRLLGNETTVGFLDMPYIRRYMTKMSKLKRASEFIQATARPTAEDWGANAIWAEMIREVGMKGEVKYKHTESDLKEIEMLIAKNNFMYVNIDPDETSNDGGDIWITDPRLPIKGRFKIKIPRFITEEEFNNLESVDSGRTYILYNPETTYIVMESTDDVNRVPTEKMLLEDYEAMSLYELYKIYYIMNEEGNIIGFYYNNKYYTYNENDGAHVVDYDETGKDQLRPPIAAHDIIHGRDSDIETDEEIIDEGSVDMNPDNQGGD